MLESVVYRIHESRGKKGSTRGSVSKVRLDREKRYLPGQKAVSPTRNHQAGVSHRDSHRSRKGEETTIVVTVYLEDVLAALLQAD